MTIKKIGHSCITVEQGGDKILIDPGWWNPGAENEKSVSAIFVTHQHEDHFDEKTVTALLLDNPSCTLYANQELVQRYADTIKIQPIEEGQIISVGGMQVEVIGKEHAFIRDGVPAVTNNGFLIDNKLFHPGDAFTIPDKKVEILALPVAAPWGKISEVITYLEKINPSFAFPIHDGMQKIYGPYHSNPKAVTEQLGGTFIELLPSDSHTF